MSKLIKRLVVEEEGQGMAEYGLILALVAIVVIAGLTFLGPKIKEKFDAVGNAMNNTNS